MRKVRCLHPYTLVEILCVIFFLALLSGFGLKYYYRFHYSYRSSIGNAIRMRRIMNISERWKRIFTGTSKLEPQIKNAKIVFGKNDYITAGKKEIVVNYRKKKYVLRLPENTSAALAVEQGGDNSYLVVLNLNWKYDHTASKKVSRKIHSVRIVSSLTVKQGDEL